MCSKKVEPSMLPGRVGAQHVRRWRNGRHQRGGRALRPTCPGFRGSCVRAWIRPFKPAETSPLQGITVSAPHTPLYTYIIYYYYGLGSLRMLRRLCSLLSTPHSCRNRCSPGYVRICVVSPPALFLPCSAPPSLLLPPLFFSAPLLSHIGGSPSHVYTVRISRSWL